MSLSHQQFKLKVIVLNFLKIKIDKKKLRLPNKVPLGFARRAQVCANDRRLGRTLQRELHFWANANQVIRIKVGMQSC